MQHNSQETQEVDQVISTGHDLTQKVIDDAKPDSINDPMASEEQLDTPNSTNSRTENSKQQPDQKLFNDDPITNPEQVEIRQASERNLPTTPVDENENPTDRKVQMSVGKQESNLPFRRPSGSTSELPTLDDQQTVPMNTDEVQEDDIKSKQDLLAIITRQQMEIRELKQSQSSTQTSRVTALDNKANSPTNIEPLKPSPSSSQASLLDEQQMKRPTTCAGDKTGSSIWQRVAPKRKEDCNTDLANEAHQKAAHASSLKRRHPVILHQMSTVSDDASSPQGTMYGGQHQNRRLPTNCQLRMQQPPTTCSTLDLPPDASPVKPLNGTFSRVSQILSTLRKCNKKQYSPYLQQGTAATKMDLSQRHSLVQTPTLSLPISHNGLANGFTRASRFDDLDSLRLGATGSQYRDDLDVAGDSVVQDLLETTEQITPIAYKRRRLDELGREVIRRKLACSFQINEDQFRHHLPQKRERQMSFMDEMQMSSAKSRDASDRVRSTRKLKEQQNVRIISKHQIANKKIRDEVPESAQIYVESGETFDFSQIKIDEQVPSTRQFTVYKYKNPRTQRNVKILLCEHANCDMFFRKWHNFFDHLRVHTGERPFKCSEPGCSQSFTQKANLNKHLAVHQRRKKQKCPMCSKIFASQHILKMHMRQHTFQMTQPSGQGSFSPFICSPLLPTTVGSANEDESAQQSSMITNNRFNTASSFQQRPADDKSFKSPMQANMQTRAHVNTVNGQMNRLLLQQQRSTATRGLSSPSDGFLPWKKQQAATMTSQVKKTASHLDDISSDDDEDDKLIGRFLVGDTSQTQHTADNTEMIKNDKILPSREFLMQSSQRKTKASFIDSMSSIRDNLDDSPSKRSSVLVKAVTSIIKQKASYAQQHSALDISPVAPLRNKKLSQKSSNTKQD